MNEVTGKLRISVNEEAYRYYVVHSSTEGSTETYLSRMSAENMKQARLLAQKTYLEKVSRLAEKRLKQIENKAMESKYISQIMLIGQDKSSTGAIIVINSENIKEYFEKHKINYDNSNDLCNSSEVNKLIKSDLKRLINSKNGFRPYEIISKIIITDKEFSIENGLLTQSLKMKRFNIMQKYEEEIEKLYQKN